MLAVKLRAVGSIAGSIWLSHAIWWSLDRHHRVTNLIHGPGMGEINQSSSEIMISLKRPECTFRCGLFLALFRSSAVAPILFRNCIYNAAS